MTDLLTQFAKAVAAYPDRTAIVNGDKSEVSFRQLHTRAAGLAAIWRNAGVRPGDRVLLAMGISSDLYASLAALWSLGATVVLPEPSMGLAGLRHAIRTTNISAFCAMGGYRFVKIIVPSLWSVPSLGFTTAPQVADLMAADSDAIALISFTSGTTGAPKAIPRTHRFLMAQHDAVAPLLESDLEERDLIAFPVFALINLAHGRTTVLPNWNMSKLTQVTPSDLRSWSTQQSVTRVLLPPVLCEKLAQTQPIETLRYVFTGGGPVFPDMVAALQNAHPKAGVTCVYGSTEAEPIAHLRADDLADEDILGMQNGAGLLVGVPTEGTQVRIVEDEIQVAGEHVNKGYLDAAHDADNKVPEGGLIWHRTGDAGRIDQGGRLWLLGRVGSQVTLPQGPTYPFALEVAVRTWKGVTACAVIAGHTTPCLVIAGDAANVIHWQTKAADMGIAHVQHISNIPMDARHASKVDRKALLRQIR